MNSAAPPLPPAVLDEAALDKLRQLDPGGKAGIVARILRTFEGSLQRLATQFDAAHAVGDRAQMRHVAHTLRSSAASIGALSLAARCIEVETQLRDVPTGPIDAALGAQLVAMRREMDRAGEAVRAMLRAPTSRP